MRLTLFGTQDCTPCLQLEAWLFRHHIQYDKQDVKENKGAWEFVQKRFGGIPVLRDNDLDKEFVGFNSRHTWRLRGWLRSVGWEE